MADALQTDTTGDCERYVRESAMGRCERHWISRNRREPAGRYQERAASDRGNETVWAAAARSRRQSDSGIREHRRSADRAALRPKNSLARLGAPITRDKCLRPSWRLSLRGKGPP